MSESKADSNSSHKLWGGRFAGGPAPELEAVNRSIDVDIRLWPFDIQLSQAWARALVGAGVPVMGHVGLTPQTATLLGGFKAQGRTAERARRLLEDALALEAAGCFAIVLEAVPPAVGRAVTQALAVPTIGIGAGPDCDGQVLVWHDMLGYYEGRAPRFVKRYAEVGTVIQEALERYAEDVRGGAFPEQQHTYAMPEEERSAFEAAAKAK